MGQLGLELLPRRRLQAGAGSGGGASWPVTGHGGGRWSAHCTGGWESQLGSASSKLVLYGLAGTGAARVRELAGSQGRYELEQLVTAVRRG